MKNAICVALYECKAKEGKEIRIDGDRSFFEEGFVFIAYFKAAIENPACTFDGWNMLRQLRTKPGGARSLRKRFAFTLKSVPEAVLIGYVTMKVIERPFAFRPNGDDHAGGNTNGHTANAEK